MNRMTENSGRPGTGSSLGVVLIAVGGLLALSNMGIIGGFGGIVGLLVLGGLGAWLLSQYYGGRRQLWLLIAGFILLGCGAATVTGDHGGAWFLGITGLGFLTVYREDARRWWAVIPAGTFLTLAAVVMAEMSWRWVNAGTVFFLGMAATFLSLYVLPRHAQSWAIIPAVASAGLALLIWGASGTWVLPVILIAAGLYMVRNGTPVNLPRFSGGGTPAARQPEPEPEKPDPTPEAQASNPPLLPEHIDSTGPEVADDWHQRGN